MRVALLVTDLERGGTPLRLARLARGLSARGLDVSVGCLAPPGPVSDALDREGIRTFACGARGQADVRALLRLAAHLRRLRPDLLHATLTHANVAARLAGDWLRIPVLTSTATIEVERRAHLLFERLTAHLDAGHIVNSRSLARHVADSFLLSPEKIHVVPPLVAPPGPRIDWKTARRGLGVPEGAFVVAWAGRFDPVKRLEVAIEAVERLSGAPETWLLLAGDGPLRAETERRIAKSPAAARIRLLGWCDDLARLFSASDVLLFPSRTEGMPNTVLQAMWFGLPVVGSDIPALRELAGADSRLMLVDGLSAPFAEALERLRRDASLRGALARRASDWAHEALLPDRAVGAVLGVYERVLASARGT